MEKKVISTLASLKQTGLEVAFIAGNRKTNEKNIKSKKDSFEKFKCNLVPLMYINGKKAVDNGCTLINPRTEDAIDSSKADSYIVIIDGQHRFQAAIESGISDDNIYLFENYSDADTKELLSAANIDSFPWSGADYINGATLFNSDNKIAQFAKELSDLDYPVTTISEIICFNSNSLKKHHYAKLMKDGNCKIKNANIERAKKFLEAARSKFDDDFISSHYLIRSVMSLSVDKGCDNVFNALKRLTETQVKHILSVKCHEKENVIKTTLEAYLD